MATNRAGWLCSCPGRPARSCLAGRGRVRGCRFRLVVSGRAGVLHRREVVVSRPLGPASERRPADAGLAARVECLERRVGGASGSRRQLRAQAPAHVAASPPPRPAATPPRPAPQRPVATPPKPPVAAAAGRREASTGAERSVSGPDGSEGARHRRRHGDPARCRLLLRPRGQPWLDRPGNARGLRRRRLRARDRPGLWLQRRYETTYSALAAVGAASRALT